MEAVRLSFSHLAAVEQRFLADYQCEAGWENSCFSAVVEACCAVATGGLVWGGVRLGVGCGGSPDRSEVMGKKWKWNEPRRWEGEME